MRRFNNTKPITGWALPVLMLGLLIGCSTDTPTAPQQQPAGPPGTASANWVLSVSVAPDILRVGDQSPALVSIDVRRADNNLAPPAGTTIVVSTSLGDFDPAGSGTTSIVLSTVNGRAQANLFPGTLTGTALITAQLEGSAGQATLQVLEQLADLVAGFSFQNTTDNLSIQFLNESTGGPDSFLWDFGDGNTSKEEHPAHLYAEPGDYAVVLEVFRGAESASFAEIVRAIQDVFITDVDPRVVTEGGRLQIRGQGFDNAKRVLVNGILANLVGGTSSLLTVDVPFFAGFPEEPCDSDRNGTLDGLIRTDLTPPNEITVEISGGVGSDSVPVDLTIRPKNARCIQQEGESDLFVTDVSPNAGPAGGGQSVTITGTGFVEPLRVFFGGAFAETVSVTPTQIVVITPPGVLATISCDVDADPETGLLVVDTLVDVLVELGAGPTHVAPGAYTYLAPLGAPCVGD